MVIAARPSGGVQRRDGFDIVPEDERKRFGEYLDRGILTTAKIRHKQFNPQVRHPAATVVDNVSEVACAAVRQVIPIDAGNDKLFELHLFGHRGDTSRLIGVGGFRLARADGAEPAVSRAHVTQNENRRRPPTPAFAAIRAVGVCADRLQPQTGKRLLSTIERLPGSDPSLEPGREFTLCPHTLRVPRLRSTLHKAG